VLSILPQIAARVRSGERVALCTVVHTGGSTPQGKGAAMLVLADGKTIGTLGGGCVEAEVRLRAQRCMNAGSSLLLNFRLDHDYGWDDGLVCGGFMDVAVQVLQTPDAAAQFEQLLQTVSSGQEATLIIDVIDDQQKPARFELPIAPSSRLLIAGAGHVGQALAEIAARLGFQVTVLDDRADYAVFSRFPSARCIVGDIERELAAFPIDNHTFIVIVTRGHRHDARALEAVVRSPACYLGLIGSRRKIRTIFQDLHARGIPLETLAAVHAPIGLEIGAVTPAEIAVSIAAELIAIRSGRADRPAEAMKIPADQLARWLEKDKIATDENQMHTDNDL
jgi:xanthine dehydrogenase accessory factor